MEHMDDFTGGDYELLWPRDLFVAEAAAVNALPERCWSDGVERLLTEAFGSDVPRARFQADRDVLEALIREAPNLRVAAQPRPYFPERAGINRGSVSLPAVIRRFTSIIAEFHTHGYLERAFPHTCVDDSVSVEVNPSDVLEERLGIAGLWPLTESQSGWDENTFYGLIEVFHDLVSRPRTAWWHDYGGDSHYGNFAREPARQLYRRQINNMLATSTAPWRLADTGEDEGRLVAVTDDSRGDLVNSLVSNSRHGTADRLCHAVALHRKRDATREEKRSAVIALVGVLEERRPLLKERLFTEDERALFRIANAFAIRHNTGDQQGDYADDFLDWMFWWYAATVELTERLLARES